MPLSRSVYKICQGRVCSASGKSYRCCQWWSTRTSWTSLIINKPLTISIWSSNTVNTLTSTNTLKIIFKVDCLRTWSDVSCWNLKALFSKSESIEWFTAISNYTTFWLPRIFRSNLQTLVLPNYSNIISFLPPGSAPLSLWLLRSSILSPITKNATYGVLVSSRIRCSSVAILSSKNKSYLILKSEPRILNSWHSPKKSIL